ncbi:MAG: exodeoxyribonuclease III [Sphingobacteriales bacterium]|nr:MAG: exodeoxyribonuclease III [Sphingobacteriales bacterium]
MKIATYNVNSVHARLPVLLRWLDETAPDVACLQELKTPDEKFPEAALNEAGYECLWQGQKSWNGVAILSRLGKPVEVARGLPGDPDDLQSRFLAAEIAGVTVGCLYLPNGNPAPGPKYEYKLRWMERFTERVAEWAQADRPVVLTGDYNVIPTPIDVYKPERWTEDALFRTETREAFEKILAQGWTDALRAKFPEAVFYTYWDYFRGAFGRNAGLRIDHFLLNPAALKIFKTGDVDKMVRGWEKTSDHAPVWITLENE